MLLLPPAAVVLLPVLAGRSRVLRRRLPLLPLLLHLLLLHLLMLHLLMLVVVRVVRLLLLVRHSSCSRPPSKPLNCLAIHLQGVLLALLLVLLLFPQPRLRLPLPQPPLLLLQLLLDCGRQLLQRRLVRSLRQVQRLPHLLRGQRWRRLLLLLLLWCRVRAGGLARRRRRCRLVASTQQVVGI